jgi:AcrR family transcriptional regulator
VDRKIYVAAISRSKTTGASEPKPAPKAQVVKGQVVPKGPVVAKEQAVSSDLVATKGKAAAKTNPKSVSKAVRTVEAASKTTSGTSTRGLRSAKPGSETRAASEQKTAPTTNVARAAKAVREKKPSSKTKTVERAAGGRPAHRPSRRAHIISSALSLFVRAPYDDVKVSDIAALADLTPAAVHYHFDGKEQILLEAMREFSAELLAKAGDLVHAEADVEAILSQLIGFLRSKRTAATVFYVSSTGLSLSFEAHRKLVRADLAELFEQAVRSDGKRRSRAEVGVMGATLVSLLEVAATTTLRGDETARALGSRRLGDVVASIAARVLR